MKPETSNSFIKNKDIIEQNTSELITKFDSAKKSQKAAESIQFEDDLSSVCMKSEASFFSRLPEPETLKKEPESQLDIEMIGDSEEKQGLIDSSDDEEDESSFKRRHKRRKRKKKFDDQRFTNKGDADHLQVEVVKRGRAKKVRVVSQEEVVVGTGDLVKTWRVGQDNEDSGFGRSLHESNVEFLMRPSRFLEQGSHDYTLLSVNMFGCLFYWVLCLTTAGILLLLDFNFDWKFYNLLKWKYVKKVEGASGVLVRGEHGKAEYLPLRMEELSLGQTDAPSVEVVVFKNGSKYYFNKGSKTFRNVRETIFKTRVHDLVEKNKRGLKHSNIEKLRKTFGPNVLNFQSPFSLTTCAFQLYHFVLLGYTFALYHFEHFVYAFVLLCCFVVSVTRTLLRKKQKEDAIRKHFEIREKVMVLRRSDEGINIKNIINSEELVPFDVVEVSNQSRVPADMVLIHGRCLVSSDRTPHMRSAIPSDRNCDLDSLEDIHFLRAGEKVDFTINNVNEGVFAMVVGTGLGTLQGFELRKLLANIGRKNRYVSQVQTFVKRNSLFVLGLASVVLMTEVFVFRSKKYIQFGKGVYDNTLRVFEMVLVLLKPVAVLLMKYVDDLGVLRLAQVGVEVNQLNTFANQLQNVQTVLLEDTNVAKCKNQIGGFMLTKQNEDDQFCLFRKPVKKAETLQRKEGESDARVRHFLMALGCCNNSAKINNSLYGNRRDEALVNASGFDIFFQESSSEKLDRIFHLEKEGLKLTEKRVFESDETSSLFSVVVEEETSEKLLLFSKGDPASVKAICKGESVPLDFDDTVRKYCNKGFRLLALCEKDLTLTVASSSSKNALRSQLETQMNFLGLVLFKKKINCKSESVVAELTGEGVQVQLMSSQNVQDCLNTASHSGLFSQQRAEKNTLDLSKDQKERRAPLVLGKTVTRNKVEKLSFCELKMKNVTHLEPREKSSLDLTSPDFILSQNVELCLTGRAFQLLVAEDNLSLLKAVMTKTRAFAELSLPQREAVINASVGVQGAFEKAVYVQTEKSHERGKNPSTNEYKRENVFNDLQRDSIEETFDRNSDLRVDVAFFRDLSQQLTSNCSLEGDLLGLSTVVCQGKDLAALNRQLVDFLLFCVWVQLVGLFLLYAKGVSLSKTEFLILDILFVFGIASLFSMPIRHQKKKKRVRSSLLISSSELDLLQKKASEKVRKSNLLVSCVLGAFVLCASLSALHKQSFYESPSQMDKADSSKAQNGLYSDPFVVFSTLCWLLLSYFLLNILSPLEFRSVRKYRALLYSLGLLGLLFYLQGLSLSPVSGGVARVLHIPYLGIFAFKQVAIILSGFFTLLVLARVVTNMIVNKSLVKQIQLKETRILEKHIRTSQHADDLTKINPKSLAQSASESEVMRRISQLDLEKLQKQSKKVQHNIEKVETRKEFRFVMKEGDAMSVEIA